MANYEEVARTNYFRVKDAEAFVTWAERIGLETYEKDGMFTLLAVEDDGWPGSFFNEATDEVEDVDIVEGLREHLVDGEVAILISAGHEKLRYICGTAVAITSQPDSFVSVTLSDIYMLASNAFGIPVSEITHAEY